MERESIGLTSDKVSLENHSLYVVSNIFTPLLRKISQCDCTSFSSPPKKNQIFGDHMFFHSNGSPVGFDHVIGTFMQNDIRFE